MVRGLTILLLASLVAGCSGGSSGANCGADCGFVAPTPGPTSNASTTLGSSPSQISFTLIQSGFSGTISLPAAVAGAGATLSATLGTSPPNGLPAASSSYGPIAYVAFTVSQTVTLNGATAVTLTYNGKNGPLPSATFYLAFFNGSSWQYDAAGPITSSGGTISFTIPATGNTTFNAGTTYGFALTTK